MKLNRYNQSFNLAFTLIELLVVISISSLLLTLGFSAYRKTQEQQLVKSSAKRVETLLRSIQKKAIIGDKDCQGPFLYSEVIINSNNNIITEQNFCQFSHGSLQTHTITNITFNNGCTLHFQPLQQGLVITSPTTSSFNLTLSLDANPNITQTIKIAQPGLILVE